MRGEASILVLVCALRREGVPFLRLVRERTRSVIDGCPTVRGHVDGTPVSVVLSGVGKERAQAAARLAIDRLHANALLSIGFAGSASPAGRAGDLVLGDRVLRIGLGGDTESQVESDRQWSSAVGGALRAKGIAAHRGALATVPEALGPRAKGRVGEATGAVAVDMESYWVGEVADQAGVTFLAVRAISDEMDDALPAFHRFADGMGELRPAAALAYFATHPGQWRPTARLAAKVRLASESLSFLADVLFSQAGAPPARRSHGRFAAR